MLKVVHRTRSDNAIREQVVDATHAESGVKEEIWRLKIRFLSVPAVAVRGTS